MNFSSIETSKIKTFILHNVPLLKLFIDFLNKINNCSFTKQHEFCGDFTPSILSRLFKTILIIFNSLFPYEVEDYFFFITSVKKYFKIFVGISLESVHCV